MWVLFYKKYEEWNVKILPTVKECEKFIEDQGLRLDGKQYCYGTVEEAAGALTLSIIRNAPHP